VLVIGKKKKNCKTHLIIKVLWSSIRLTFWLEY